MKTYFHILTTIVAFTFFACSETPMETHDTHENHVPIELRIIPKFGASDLRLATPFVTAADDTVSFSAIKFYLSGINLIDTLGGEHELDGIYMVDLEDAAFAAKGYLSLAVEADPGYYRGIRFSVGVPTDQNHRDAATQQPPLGPNSGMYWTWNPGYIFHMMEGTVDSSGTKKGFAFHIGEDARKTTIQLATISGPSATSFEISDEGGEVFTVNADYAKIFERGVDPAQPLEIRDSPFNRMHHVGPKSLADRTFLNSTLLFTRGQ